jgi:phosphate-selective porin O/P
MKMSRTRTTAAIALLGGLCVSAEIYAAGTIKIDDERSVTIGGGLRAGYSSTQDAAPDGTDPSNSFSLQSARLYLSGSASKTVKFTLNTECKDCVFGEEDSAGAGGRIDVLDAIAQFELKPEFNIWVGRMLTPADRIEMNGPYYGLSWNQYTVPLLPSDQTGKAGLLGRDDGVTIWGKTGKFIYAAGLFDGVDGGPNQKDSMLFATRLSYNFLSMEDNPAYYTSSTYFGTAGDIFTLALSYQHQSDGVGTAAAPADFSAYIVDMLYENALDGGSAVTIEAEYKVFDAKVTPAAAASPTCFCLFDGKAYFVTGAYLFASTGKVKWQPYVRYTSNEPDGGAKSSDLTEVGLNIVIKGHNARMNVSYTSGDANLTGSPGPDVDTVSFGVQVQI